MTSVPTGIVVIALGLGLAGLFAGDAATVGVGQQPSGVAADPSAREEVNGCPARPVGTGRAFSAAPAIAGRDQSLRRGSV
jgi:hypothetical protein